MSSTREPGRRRPRAIAAITTAGTSRSSHVACAATPGELEPPEPPAAPVPPPPPAPGGGTGAGVGGVKGCERVFVVVCAAACVTTMAFACVAVAVAAANETARTEDEREVDAV